MGLSGCRGRTPTTGYKTYALRSEVVGNLYASDLQLSEGRDDRQPGGPDGGQEAADQAHQYGVHERLSEELRRHGELEGNLAERLEIHRRGLVPVERQIGDHAADDTAGERQQRC